MLRSRPFLVEALTALGLIAAGIWLYERKGRMDEYERFVERFKKERTETLRKYPDLDDEIVRAVA